jgi:hypothetical protein
MKHFDKLTQEKLQYYVYVLVDPRTKQAFYIGKGKGNRVFEHVLGAIKESFESDKIDTIKAIRKAGHSVQHVIIRHGLTEDVAFKIESSLIDFTNYLGGKLTNEVLGHGSCKFGLMTAQEIVSTYNAQPLAALHHKVIIININNSYERAKGGVSIYESTKQAWVIGKNRLPTLEYALAEYRGIIVGVYKIKDWYKVILPGSKRVRRGFNGEEACEEIKVLYLNKSVKHTKKKGAANPIRYIL